MIINLKARVRIITEDDFDLAAQDLNLPDKSFWGKRTIAIDSNEIYKVINLREGECLVILYQTYEKLYVYERFKDVVEKWNKATEEDRKFDSLAHEAAEETAEQGDEEDDEEDD